jgi:ubiquinone/menaquinone biosynthesis C-methylase UbiE
MMYEAIVRWPSYHRIAWGTSIPAYAQFSRAALDAAGTEHFAEVGCGSLLFTAPMYQHARTASILLVDRSVEMLRRALERLSPENRTLPTGVMVLHADGTTLPVRSRVFSSVLSLNLFHVPCDRKALVAEFRRILIPGRGQLFLSSLVRSGRWSDAYLGFLHAMGEFGTPLTAEEVGETVADGWGVIESVRVEGNMSYVIVRHAG